MPIRRSLKNVVNNFSLAQVKVREATSNDPWGPPSTLMSEVADLTYNIVACSEIMQMVWKRVNDHGKNWRHVYKALVLLDYIIKTGSERVAQQCKENIFAIQTLKDFQYEEEGKDHGMNVREKAKQLVSLLKDDERLKVERSKALKAKERFAQNTTGIGRSGGMMVPASTTPPSLMPGSEYPRHLHSKGGYSDLSSSPPSSQPAAELGAELEAARPSTAGEEELQLQLALAMSREEHDDDLRKQRGDDMKLQMALDESVKEQRPTLLSMAGGGGPPASDPWSAPSADPWGAAGGEQAAWAPPTLQPPPPVGAAAGPWLSPPVAQNPPAVADPWTPPSPPPGGAEPWGPGGATNGGAPSHTAAVIDDEFDLLSARVKNTVDAPGSQQEDPSGGSFPLTGLANPLTPASGVAGGGQDPRRKSPADFLGENAGLVNLDNLVTKPAANAGSTNPFANNGSILSGGGGGGGGGGATASNPFSNVQAAARIPLNMLPTASSTGFTQPTPGGASMLPAPLLPMNSDGGGGGAAPGGTNPFL